MAEAEAEALESGRTSQRKVHTVSSYKRTLQRQNGHYLILSIFPIHGIVNRYKNVQNLALVRQYENLN